MTWILDGRLFEYRGFWTRRELVEVPLELRVLVEACWAEHNTGVRRRV